MILHKFVDSPFSNQTLTQSIERIAPDDAVILMEDAVYTLKDSTLTQKLKESCKHLYVLSTDAEARGLDASHLQCIDYEALVDLVIEYDNVIAW